MSEHEDNSSIVSSCEQMSSTSADSEDEETVKYQANKKGLKRILSGIIPSLSVEKVEVEKAAENTSKLPAWKQEKRVYSFAACGTAYPDLSHCITTARGPIFSVSDMCVLTQVVFMFLWLVQDG
jgi:hypothetical protein